MPIHCGHGGQYMEDEKDSLIEHLVKANFIDI